VITFPEVEVKRVASGLSFCHSQAKADRGGGEVGSLVYDAIIQNPYTARLDPATKFKYVKKTDRMNSDKTQREKEL
jgi:hypothetical protein